MHTKQKLILLLFTLILLIATIFSLGLGAFHIPVQEVVVLLCQKMGFFGSVTVDEMYSDVLFIIRMPRVLLGVLVGAALGISGAAIQGIFRNPLAEPGLIGISAGASLFAAVVISFEAILLVHLAEWMGAYVLAFAAFAGAGLAALLVYQISKKNGRSSVTTMLLAGIAINALAGALTGLMTYMASEQELRTITFWMLGSLGGASWDNITVLALFVGIPLILLPFFSKELNAFSLGESQADLLGMRVDHTKKWVVVLSTLAVGAAVAVSGIIGFVGLLVPHMVRLIGGVDHRYVLPGSMLMGAFILTLADVLSRILIAPIELPIGVITAILGTPVFLYILIKEKQ